MRHHGLKSQITNYKLRNSQSGYMLITLMLALTLITIALLAAIPNIRQQVTRDREEEMTHRGTAYMRAIQHFYKKFNRYPNKIEELENTNNVRFLRRRYTDHMNRDPATGKERDFKFLHQQDVMLNSGPVLPGGLGQNGLAGLQGPGGMQAAMGALAGLAGAGQQQGLGAQTAANSDINSPAGSSSTGSPSSGNPNAQDPSVANPNGTSSNGFNGPTLGGGPILGVASASKAKSIRVYFKKDHYNDWLFIYTTQMVGGGLLIGPINPGMPSGGNMGGLTPGQMAAGAQGQGGSGQGGFGQGGFGQGGMGQSGFGQGGPGQGGFGQGSNGGQQPQTPQTPAQPPQ